jgi:hypothetical protein
MESHILLTPQTTSISGIQNSPGHVLAPIFQPTKPSPSNPIILENSQPNLPPGERIKQSDQENLATAEELELNQKEFNQPNILTMTHEEFYQWRQVLGQFKNDLSKTIKLIQKSKTT